MSDSYATNYVQLGQPSTNKLCLKDIAPYVLYGEFVSEKGNHFQCTLERGTINASEWYEDTVRNAYCWTLNVAYNGELQSTDSFNTYLAAKIHLDDVVNKIQEHPDWTPKLYVYEPLTGTYTRGELSKLKVAADGCELRSAIGDAPEEDL